MKSQEIIAIVIVVIVGIAFLGTVFMPVFHVTPDPQATSIVYTLFGGLVGAGGMFLTKQAQVSAANTKAEAAQFVVQSLNAPK